MFRKKGNVIYILLSIILLLSGCGLGNSSSDIKKEFDIDGFLITVKDYILEDDLSGTTDSVQYDGAIQKIEYEQKASDGKVFLLLNIKVEKQQGENKNFTWDDVYIRDSKDNKYPRHDNDTFLENYGFERIKSIDLNFGANEGYACFEISKDLSKKGLVFVYEYDQNELQIKIN